MPSGCIIPDWPMPKRTAVVAVHDLPRGQITPDMVYVGRNRTLWLRFGGIGEPPFGNPFVMRDESQRHAVIGAFAAWLGNALANSQRFAEQVSCLTDKILVCHCAPRVCHGHVLGHAAECLADGRTWSPEPWLAWAARFAEVAPSWHPEDHGASSVPRHRRR